MTSKLRCNDRDRAASDAQISEWEYEAEQPHPNHQDWRILQLCARIKAEREQTIRECAEIALNEPLLLTPAHGPRPQKRIHDKILALLTNKGEQPA